MCLTLVRKMFVLSCCVSVSMSAFAYEVTTHEDLSEQAVLRSKLKDVLPSIGLKTTNDPLTDIDTTRTIAEWIIIGANHEDDTISANFARYRNHFFDPQHGVAGYSFGALSGEPSLDWALEDTKTFITQSYSFKKARQYFYDALTLRNKDTREQWMARTFYTLGHVIHHPQDMAQPQHVRNDDHCDVWPCRLVPGLYNPSRYEEYTLGKGGNLPFTDAHYNAGIPVRFPTPRHFWTAAGQGLADFTNRNFVSAGTNYQLFNGNPVPGAAYFEPIPSGFGPLVPIEQLFNEIGETTPLTGLVGFVENEVYDRRTGITLKVKNAITRSYT